MVVGSGGSGAVVSSGFGCLRDGRGPAVHFDGSCRSARRDVDAVLLEDSFFSTRREKRCSAVSDGASVSWLTECVKLDFGVVSVRVPAKCAR